MFLCHASPDISPADVCVINITIAAAAAAAAVAAAAAAGCHRMSIMLWLYFDCVTNGKLVLVILKSSNALVAPAQTRFVAQAAVSVCCLLDCRLGS